jgi:hypothetical protein
MMVGGVVKAAQVLKQAANEAATKPAQSQQVMFQPLPTETVPAAPEAVQTAVAPAPIVYALDANQAGDLGMQIAGFGETLAVTPELVDYNGAPVYEVVFTDSNLLYIDAQSGTLLYNSLTGDNTPTVSQDEAIAIAQQFTGDGRVYSVRQTVYKDQIVYEIRFANNDRARVNAHGQVVYVWFDWSVEPTQNQPVANSNNSSPNPQPSGDDGEGEHD